MFNGKDEWLSHMQAILAEEFDASSEHNMERLERYCDILDVFWHPSAEGPPSITEIQQAYRHQLWRCDPYKAGLPKEAIAYRNAKLECMKTAYKRICQILKEDPEVGLEETEESLTAEMNEMLNALSGYWCGTPAFNVSAEYEDRINALKQKES